MFGKKESKLSDSQIKKLNSLLNDKFKKEEWTTKDFRGDDCIYSRVSSHMNTLHQMLISSKKELHHFLNEGAKEFQSKINEERIKKITLFNTEIYEAIPLGLVDIGRVKKFGTASTGNRFENGVIGYAIENASDQFWANNNSQENALNEVKFELIKKAKTLYPKCNMIFKFESDFRELGSSGNVFIYLKGTASIGNNNELLKFEEKEVKLLTERNKQKKEIENKILVIQKEYDFISKNYNKIPQNKKDIKNMLGL